MPDPSTLPADIYHILNDETDHAVSEENVEWAGEVFKNVLRARFKKRATLSGEDVIRFSSLGKKERQIWYAANMPEAAEPMPPKANFKFLYGDVIEILLLFLAREAGHEVTHEQFEVNEDGVLGHTDCCIDGVPVDVKSASPFSYEKFANGGFVFDDPFGYLQQLSGYANKLGKTDRAGFLVADKVHGDIAFAEIDGYTIRGNTPRDAVSRLRAVVANPDPPARCYSDEPHGKSGNRKLAVGCSYCKFKNECWKDANKGQGLRTFMYSKGPVFLTEVKKEPKVNESDAS